LSTAVLPVGFRVKGDHEEEVVVDHCTMDTFDSMQSAEDTVTIVNPGQRYDNVGSHDVDMPCTCYGNALGSY
jgi:hypothetical protein